MNNIEELIRNVDSKYIKKENKYYFKYNNFNICYDGDIKMFFFDKTMFSKVPHIMPDGSLCLYGNKNVQLNEMDEYVLVKNTVNTYIPWLINISPEVKVIEFINEIEYYLKRQYKTNVKKLKKTEPVYKTIKIATPNELWEVIETLKNDKIYEIYPNGYPEYKLYIKKKKREFVLNYDLYNKARLRVLGNKISDVIGKIGFIGIGSVNSYIIKQYLARNVKEIVLIDNDKFKIDNVFRFAFPYKNKTKIECVKEYVKILQKPVKIEGYNITINAKSSNLYIKDCNKIYVSVDTLYSWLVVMVYLKNNAPETASITLAGIDAFGGFGKFINTTKTNIEKDLIKFLFYNEGSNRRMMVGNGCGKSLAVYDEEGLNKLAKNVLSNKDLTGEVIKVEFEA